MFFSEWGGKQCASTDLGLQDRRQASVEVSECVVNEEKGEREME